ncbi:MAG: hypothetical protein JXR23_03890 [Pontiellaceae bacterium]|nr:hypothetical protein [Pontiellaceae bacterium]
MSKKLSGSIILIVLGLIFIAAIGMRTISTPQIWTHLALGKTGAPIAFTEADRLVNPTWLYDKLAYAVWNVGKAPLLILLNTLGLLGAFVLLLRTSKKWGGELSQSFALLVSGHLIFQMLDVGPEVPMMLFLAAFLYVLSTQSKPAILFGALIPLQLIWTNMHGSFLYGPLLALLAAMEAVQRSKKKRSAATPATYGILVLALLVTTLLNPSLLNLHLQVVKEISSPDPAYVSSLLSDFFQSPPLKPLILFVVVLGAAGILTQKKRLPILLTTAAVFGAVMGLTSPKMTLLFAVLSFPFMVLSFTAVSEYIRGTLKHVMGEKEPLLWPISGGLWVILLIISVMPIITNRAYVKAGSASSFGLGIEAQLYPAGLKALINDPAFPAPEKTLNLPADGGYLAFNYDRKVLIDYRPGRYSHELIDGISEVILGEATTCEGLDGDADAIILNTLFSSSSAGIDRLLGKSVQPRWLLAYFDGTTAVLLRNEGKYRALANNADLKKAGLDKLDKAYADYAQAIEKGGLAVPGNPAELIGGAKVFLARGQAEAAKSFFALLLKGNEDLSAAWIGLGQSQLKLAEEKGEGFELAVDYLRSATETAPRSAQAWSAYANVCAISAAAETDAVAKGEFEEEAKRAEEKAESLVKKSGKKDSSDKVE